jgi:hypothetical protein
MAAVMKSSEAMVSTGSTVIAHGLGIKRIKATLQDAFNARQRINCWPWLRGAFISAARN